jgi:hypothetical protein
MKKTTCYSIAVSMSKPAPVHLGYQEDKHEMYLSANGALSGPKQCQLDTRELAEKFLEAYMPRLQKRYGADVQADVIPCETICSGESSLKRLKARIEADSKIARKRLETGLLAPNARLFD